MTHFGNVQALAEVLLCPEEAEGVCLYLTKTIAAASVKEKNVTVFFSDYSQDKHRAKQKQHIGLSYGSSLNATNGTDILKCASLKLIEEICEA